MDSPVFDGREFAGRLTTRPGVYRMLGVDEQVLYVGKASNLRARVSSYFNRGVQQPRIASMVGQVHHIEVTVTRTASEALLLEDQLIKALKPRYNVMLRDDKSYPYIFLSEHQYPRLSFHRGPQRAKGQYFGPYPSAYAVRDSLKLMQKLFRVRQCEDNFFANRSRPCLQYQIKRCTAPCVAAIDPDQYANDVRHATLFLQGRSQLVIDELAQRMAAASDRLEFEQAAQLRDQVSTLQAIQAQQFVLGGKGDLDIIAVAGAGNAACVSVFFVRAGRNLGNRSFFPRNVAAGGGSADSSDVLSAFISQYYVDKELPPELLVSEALVEPRLLAEAFSERAGRKVRIVHRPRGDKLKWLAMARQSATAALQSRLAGHSGMRKRLQALADLLQLDEPPGRIECFDISHTQGEATVASCVVFDAEGPVKSDYRRFNIRSIQAGDDYAAMHQVLERRYSRLKSGEGKLPDLLLIDGGKGQVSQALDVLDELQLDQILVVGVAKGVSRRVGAETLITGRTGQETSPPADNPGFQLIHHVRDEAHRFAITGHRAQRAKARQTSSLEQIAGIGAARRKALLARFGGIQGVKSAGIEELSLVPGISQALAQRIYDALHG